MNRFVLGLCSFLLVAAGSGNVLAANPCVSTLSDNFHLSAPAMKIGPGEYRVEFDFSSSGPDAIGGAWFFVTDAGASQVGTCSNPAQAIADAGGLLLRFPVLLVAGTGLWVELEYVPSTDGKLWFRLTNRLGLLSNRVFRTSVKGTGNLGSWPEAAGNTGLTAGDAICQARAGEAGLDGTFVAWLSDETNDAYCRVQGFGGKIADNCGQSALPNGAGPWIRTDGFPFGEFEPGNTAMKVLAPPRCTEFADCTEDVLHSPSAYTGTNSNGAVSPVNETCGNWTNDTAGYGKTGPSSATTTNWTSGSRNDCVQNHPLFCFEAGSGQPLPGFAVSGKTAFLSSRQGSGDLGTWPESGGNSGVAAGDAICRTLAADAGLANADRFRAWLSDDQENAGIRITSEGPWVRLDGVLVARSHADLLDGSLFAPANLTETRTYVGNYLVWTGTDKDGLHTGTSCQGWRNGTDEQKGMGGVAADAGSVWTQFYEYTCDNAVGHIYCFED